MDFSLRTPPGDWSRQYPVKENEVESDYWLLKSGTEFQNWA